MCIKVIMIEYESTHDLHLTLKIFSLSTACCRWVILGNQGETFSKCGSIIRLKTNLVETRSGALKLQCNSVKFSEYKAEMYKVEDRY